MNIRKFNYTCTAVAAAAVLATTTVAFAAMDKDNDARVIDQAKVSMTQAVAAAEQHASGKAVKAEYEKTEAGWAWDVEVVNGAKVMDVRVDAASGAVLSAKEDAADQDDERDEID